MAGVEEITKPADAVISDANAELENIRTEMESRLLIDVVNIFVDPLCCKSPPIYQS